MTPRELTAFRLDEHLLRGLRILKERDDIPISEQVRRAVEDWLKRNNGEPRSAHAAFDQFEGELTSAGNRRTGLDRARLPKGFGPVLGGRTLASLNEREMDILDRFAHAAGRKTKAHRDAWVRARQDARARAHKRNMRLLHFTDDEIRRELFGALTERLQLEQGGNRGLQVFERAPILQALTANGHLLEVDQGEGTRVMRGEVKWRPGPDEDKPFVFSVSRTADRRALAMHPGPEGNFDDIIDNIVVTFLTQSND